MDGAGADRRRRPLSPLDTWYGDHLYWFDRMVRSGHQLVERLALVFHDWWATTNDAVGSNEMMLAQTNVFRTHGLGSFREMTRAMTTDPAMLVFLNGIDNRRRAVNENYARELMELFTLGADRGAYTETDVRELARALTGWRADWSTTRACTNFRFDTTRWDSGSKTVFGSTGASLGGRLLAGASSIRCTPRSSSPSSGATSSRRRRPPASPPRSSSPTWARATRSARCSRRSCARRSSTRARGWSSRRSCSAGMLRALERTITGEQWVVAGRRRRPAALPPAGRVGLGRQALAGLQHDPRALGPRQLRRRGRTIDPGPAATSYPAETAEQALAAARAFWLDPDATGRRLRRVRAAVPAAASRREPRAAARGMRAQRQNALRHLIAVSADYQTS